MAEKVIRVDDLDGSEGADVARREFEVLSHMFGIDLSDENEKRLRELLDELAPFIEHAVEVKQATKPRKPQESPTKLAGGHTNSDAYPLTTKLKGVL